MSAVQAACRRLFQLNQIHDKRKVGKANCNPAGERRAVTYAPINPAEHSEIHGNDLAE